jgi:poly(3-hydroxybutyrate) depolymerase
VLYPAQSVFANPARCWNWSDVSRGGEVDEVHRLVLETWLVRGMGHAWSGGDARGSHTFPPGPDATEAMLRFLADL